MKNICDEINPNCIVKACCSQKCSEVIKKIRLYKLHMIRKTGSRGYYSSVLFEKHECPICGYNSFKHNGKAFHSCNSQLLGLICTFCETIYSVRVFRFVRWDIISIDKSKSSHPNLVACKIEDIISMINQKLSIEE